VESAHPKVEGLGLLNIDTMFHAKKTTCQVEARVNQGAGGRGQGSGNCEEKIIGYEIHMGTSSGDIDLFTVNRLSAGGADVESVLDGSMNGNCWGTYLHGIFENDSFRRGVVNCLRERKGLPLLSSSITYAGTKEKALDKLADMVRENLDMKFIKGCIGL
jgi:adenosylcobyric acid synthase